MVSGGEHLVEHPRKTLDGFDSSMTKGLFVTVERCHTICDHSLIRFVDGIRNETQEVYVHFLLILLSPVDPRRMREFEILSACVVNNHCRLEGSEPLLKLLTDIEVPQFFADVSKNESGAVVKHVPGSKVCQVQGEIPSRKYHSPGLFEEFVVVAK